jgi:catechol-2,3-dioxygenase
MDFDHEQPDGKVLAPKHFAHVVLRTSPENFAKQTEFYKTFLGAFVQYENESLCFMAYDDEHHRVALAAIPGLAPKNPMTAGLEVGFSSC